MTRTFQPVRVTAVAGAMALAATAGCAPSSSGSEVLRTDSAGVEIVVSRGADRALPRRFERVWSIGGSGDDRLELSSLAPHQVAADAAGRVYLLAADAGRVLVVADGVVVDTLGRRGGGPGELAAPLALSVDADSGIVAVYDAGKGGLVRWSRTGEVLPTTPISAMVWGPAVEVTGAGVVFTSFAGQVDQSTRLDLLLWDPNAEVTLAGFTSAPHHPADFPTCGQRGARVSPLFSPELVWDAAGGRVVVNAGAAYEVVVHAAGRPVRDIRREVEPVPVTRAMALREVGDGVWFGAVGCTIPPDEAVRGYGWAEVLPAITRLALSPAGELWVLRGSVPDEPARVDVFSADGAYAGTLPSGAPYPAAFLPGNRIVAIESDAMGVPAVAVYRVR